MIQNIISILIGYLFGNFLTAEIVSRKYTGKNIRQIGSGNPGMANVMSNIGKKQGILVLTGDVVKMLFAFALAWFIAGKTHASDIILWTGFGGILGHNFPFWRKFHGGKGVTVTCTWLIIFMPLWGTLCCIIGGVVTLITGYLPLGAILIPLLAIPFAFWQKGMTAGIVFLISALIMITRHLHGLKRIAQGTESRKFRNHSS